MLELCADSLGYHILVWYYIIFIVDVLFLFVIGAVALTNAFFGVGTGPINVDNTACFGNEATLADCDYNPNHNCIHFEDAGVRCLAGRQ